MTTLIKETKTKTYINFNGQIFVTTKNFADKNFTPVNFDSLNDQQRNTLQNNSWEEFENGSTLEEVYDNYITRTMERRAEQKIKSEIFEQELNNRHAAEWEAIKDLETIPATLENIRIVLTQLNLTNWGIWKLPTMSIGYSAHQYDCDGVLAATMKFDTAIEGQKMFKVGGKRGHLNNYQSL